MQEAFPQDRDWAFAIERSSRRMQRVGSVLLASAIGIALGLALVHWWST
jgi:hypothetical protein